MEIHTILYYIAIFTSSFLMIIVCQKIFLKQNIIDQKNNRSSHNVLATRSGGVSIFLIVFVVSIINYIQGNEIYDFSLIIPLSLLMVVGLYDDLYKLDFKLKFIFQIIAAKIIIDNGLIIDNLHGVLGIFELNRILAQLFTILIIVSIINAVNFIDGIDGLAISVFMIFMIFFEFFSAKPSLLSNLTYLFLLSVVPLYYYNFKKKNKVFLGDSGSLFLGGTVSIYVIFSLTNLYVIKEEFDLHKIIFVISILIYPILDIVRVFFIRLLNGKSPFIADRNHIHHLILNNTNSHLKTTVIIVSFSLLFLFIVQSIF